MQERKTIQECLREELALHTAEFLRKGGVITEVPNGMVSGQKPAYRNPSKGATDPTGLDAEKDAEEVEDGRKSLAREEDGSWQFQ